MKRGREEKTSPSFDWVILQRVGEEVSQTSWHVVPWKIWTMFGVKLSDAIHDEFFLAKIQLWDWDATAKNKYEHVRGPLWIDLTDEEEFLDFQLAHPRCVVLCHMWEERGPREYAAAYKKLKQ